MICAGRASVRQIASSGDICVLLGDTDSFTRPNKLNVAALYMKESHRDVLHAAAQ